MKIVLNIYGIFHVAGGAERALVDLANELLKRGHKVAIVIDQKNVTESDKPYYYLEDGVEVYNINQSIETDTLSSSNQRNSISFVKTIRRKITGHIEFRIKQTLDHFNKYYFFYYLSWRMKYRNKIRNLKNQICALEPDIVISFLSNTFIFTVEAVKHTGIPIIVSIRNDPRFFYDKNDHHKFNLKYRAVKKATASTVQNIYFKSFFSESMQAKTYVLPNAVKQVSNKSDTGTVKLQNVIISVGRLHPQKNFGLLINAFGLIAHKYPDWVVKVFGEGELYTHLEELIKDLHLENRFLLMGVTKSINQEYGNSSIFALPSLYEGFSNALTEAMAHGLPSVAIEDCFTNKELIEKGECGLITKNDPADFAVNLEFLMNHPGKRLLYGKNAIEHVKQFEPEKVYNMWEEIMYGVTKKDQLIQQ